MSNTHIWIDDGNSRANSDRYQVQRDDFRITREILHLEDDVQKVNPEEKGQKWEDGAHLKKEKEAGDNCHSIVTRQVFDKILVDAVLREWKTDEDHCPDECVSECDEGEANGQVTRVVLLPCVVLQKCNDGRVDAVGEAKHAHQTWKFYRSEFDVVHTQWIVRPVDAPQRNLIVN